LSILSESPIYNLMLEATRKSARPLIRDFGEMLHLQSSFKGTQIFAEKTYNRVNEILFEILTEFRPDYKIYNIDCVEDEFDTEYRWIIEPLEGRKNFEHGLPYFATIVMLQKLIEGKFTTTELFIDAPGLEESFYCKRQVGAWGDNYSRFAKGLMKLKVSQRKTQKDCFITTDCLQMQREFIGADLLTAALIASGKIDACVMSKFHPNKQEAAKLLVTESGGKYIDHAKYFILGNSVLQSQLQEIK
jgi:myo-inositol-1(or 4)-monophosphatase